jgi:hypothetical protein
MLVRRSQYSPGGYLPPHKIPLAGNRFLQTCKGAENTKEKSRQWLYELRNDLAGISQCITRRALLNP